MTKNNNIVKKDLLRRKINEYFSKNPSAKMVIIKADVGGNKTHWKVTKEGKSFKVVEVNTVKEEYIFEAPAAAQTSVGREKKPFEYDPDQKPGMTPPKGGTVAPGQEPQKKMPGWVGQAGKKDPKDPAVTPQQSMGQWDPNNPTGAFARLVKSVGMNKAMLGMPDMELKKHFGLSKQSLKAQSGKDPVGQARAKRLGMKPYGEGVVNEGSPEFGRASTMFTQAMTPPFDHAKQSRALKDINAMLPAVKDATERNQVGAMIGALTSMVDSTTAGGGSKLNTSADTGATPIQETERSKKKDSALREEEPPAPEAPGSDVGLDKEPAPAPQPVPTVEKSPVQVHEDQIVGKSLSGQVIRDARVTFDSSGGSLELQLMTVQNPVKLEWKRNGRVVYHFKGRPYFLKK